MHDSLAQGRALVDYVGGATICEGLEGATAERTYAIAQAHTLPHRARRRRRTLAAVGFAYRALGLVVEPSAAVGLAAARAGRVATDEDTVIVITGSNIDPTCSTAPSPPTIAPLTVPLTIGAVLGAVDADAGQPHQAPASRTTAQIAEAHAGTLSAMNAVSGSGSSATLRRCQATVTRLSTIGADPSRRLDQRSGRPSTATSGWREKSVPIAAASAPYAHSPATAASSTRRRCGHVVGHVGGEAQLRHDPRDAPATGRRSTIDGSVAAASLPSTSDAARRRPGEHEGEGLVLDLLGHRRRRRQRRHERHQEAEVELADVVEEAAPPMAGDRQSGHVNERQREHRRRQPDHAPAPHAQPRHAPVDARAVEQPIVDVVARSLTTPSPSGT